MEDVYGSKLSYQGATNTLELTTTSNSITTKKMEFENTPTGYIHFHNTIDAGLLKNYGDMETT